MEHKTQVTSQTGAMKAVYEAKTQDLNEYLKAFNRVPEQKGVLVYLNGEPVGFDFLSKEKAFEILFPKLIKSYAMEAILDQKQAAGPQEKRDPEGFLKEAAGARRKNTPPSGWAPITAMKENRSSVSSRRGRPGRPYGVFPGDGERPDGQHGQYASAPAIPHLTLLTPSGSLDLKGGEG